MLRHIEESTNTVKSRQRLTRWVELLSFLVIWAVCVAAFWLGAGEAGAMGYNLTVLWGVLPLSLLVVSFLVGLDRAWGSGKWFLLFYFGGLYLLAPFCTFSLANTMSTGNFPLIDWGALAAGLILSAVGMGGGSLALSIRTKCQRRQ